MALTQPGLATEKMSSQGEDAAARLQDTIADGRLANPFYRQQQLRKIQKSLIERKDILVETILKDSSVTRTEAFMELYSTVSAVKSYFDQTSPVEGLETEYAVAYNHDAPLARQAVGIVIIRPQLHTLLFSTISPLCAALAAGNAVLLIFKQTLLQLPPAIVELLKESLDPGIVEISSSEPTGLGASLYVNQLADGSFRDVLSCQQQARTVAIVDRTCDLQEAAQALCHAQMAFGGASQYTPDFIFVNEFIKSDFTNALMTCCLENHDKYPLRPKGHLSPDNGIVDNVAKGSTRISAGAWGEIIEITQRECLASLVKAQGSTFYVHAYRSLEDVIETCNNCTSDNKLAAFCFGDPKTCKYILQFVNADACFANIVPKELFVGPAAPRGYPIELCRRYSLDMFSMPRPQYSLRTSSTSTLDVLLGKELSAAFKTKILDELKVPERGPANQDTGYFELGVKIGASAIFLPILAGGVTGIFFAVKRLI